MHFETFKRENPDLFDAMLESADGDVEAVRRLWGHVHLGQCCGNESLALEAVANGRSVEEMEGRYIEAAFASREAFRPQLTRDALAAYRAAAADANHGSEATL